MFLFTLMLQCMFGVALNVPHKWYVVYAKSSNKSSVLLYKMIGQWWISQKDQKMQIVLTLNTVPLIILVRPQFLD